MIYLTQLIYIVAEQENIFDQFENIAQPDSCLLRVSIRLQSKLTGDQAAKNLWSRLSSKGQNT